MIHRQTKGGNQVVIIINISLLEINSNTRNKNEYDTKRSNEKIGERDLL